jgi:sigma-B regulation protein RsbU (phosphoserine phosphatase)
VLLYTDGVTEAQNERGEEFAEDRLMHAAAEGRELDPQGVIAHVTSAVQLFVSGQPLADDLTCLVLRYAGATAPA